MDLQLEQRIDKICEEFEDCLEKGVRPRVADQLKKIGSEHREELMAALIRSEVAYLVEQDLTVTPASYFEFGKAAVIAASDLLKELKTSSGRTTGFPDVSKYGYEVIEQIGHGGMGIVYKARQLQPRRLAALKFLSTGMFASNTDVARFRAEALAISKLNHSGIVSLYEVAGDDVVPFISMAFIEGQSLAALLDSRALEPLNAAKVLLDVSRAIAFAHAKGVIHRDIKPGNILMDGNGIPYVTDFGIAKTNDSLDGLTATGEIVGTPSYMSPEQAIGDSRLVGASTDVYSLGALLYEALTQRPPFHGSTLSETIRQVTEEPPIPPKELAKSIPRDLQTICLKCLEKEPQHRYKNANALAEDLDMFLKARPIRARRPSVFRVTSEWSKRNPTPVGVFAGIGLVIVVATSILSSLVAMTTLTNSGSLSEESDQVLFASQIPESETLEISHQLKSQIQLPISEWSMQMDFETLIVDILSDETGNPLVRVNAMTIGHPEDLRNIVETYYAATSLPEVVIRADESVNFEFVAEIIAQINDLNHGNQVPIDIAYTPR